MERPQNHTRPLSWPVRTALFAALVSIAACASSERTAPPATRTPEAAITAMWTTFFNGATSVDEKATLLEQGAAHTADIHTFFTLFPPNLATKVDSVRINGATATVTYEFLAGTSPLSTRPMTGTAVNINSHWFVSLQTWSAWVARSDIHGSG